MVATGNVVYTSPQTRIAAERLEFDLDTKIGTFYNATGSTYLGEKVDKSYFGTQEPDALFYGELVQKVGPEALQDHARRLHELRPADATLGAGLRASTRSNSTSTPCSRTPSSRSRACRCSTCR